MNYGYIYKTTNLVNSKIYIGQSKGEFNSDYFGSGIILKQALNKYGKDKFSLEVVVYADDKNKLNELEKQYIAEYKEKFGKESLYNLSEGGVGGNNRTGPLTEEMKKKISNSLTGKECPWLKGDKNPSCRSEVKEKNRLAHLGKKASIETRMKLSRFQKGKKRRLRSAEHCKNLSLSLKGRKVWNKGLTKEIDNRLAVAGRKISETKLLTKNYSIEEIVTC